MTGEARGRLPAALDAAVASAHRLRVAGRPYHPYHAATDASAAAILAVAAAHARLAPGFGLWQFLAAFAIMQAIYALFLRFKARSLGIASRSYLQDTLAVVLPAYLGASALLGNALAPSLDMAALGLAAGIALIRVGCFAGGCCYGVPWRHGVRYTPDLLRPTAGCRRFSPGAAPPGRVLPIQLGESAFNAAAFALLAGWTWTSPAASGRALPAYFLAYSAWRFASDFWRIASTRPRRAGLSEAQWISLLLGASSATILAFTGP